MWRLKETVHREAHNAGRDEEPRVRAAAQDGPQATDRAEDNANVVHQTATEAAQENKEKNSITNRKQRREHKFCFFKVQLTSRPFVQI